MSKSVSEQSPIDVHLSNIYKTLERIEHKVEGSPTTEAVGNLDKRVASLEENRKWFILSIGALVIKSLWDLIVQGGR